MRMTKQASVRNAIRRSQEANVRSPRRHREREEQMIFQIARLNLFTRLIYYIVTRNKVWRLQLATCKLTT